MAAALPPPAPPATSIAEVIARMNAIDAVLPAADGIACFNRMYLDVTTQVDAQVEQGLFGDPGFVAHLDVVFANLYFSAVDSLTTSPEAPPVAWKPLLMSRSTPGIEPIQFALAGMNAHINHDLPLAVVTACTDLSTAPGDGSHHADYQRVDGLLDASEQAIRQAFETPEELATDRHVAAVASLVSNWSMNTARDVAWNESMALWDIRDHPQATALLTTALGHTVAMVSRALLVVL
jgi:Family of unknown function (DUF5995)